MKKQQQEPPSQPIPATAEEILRYALTSDKVAGFQKKMEMHEPTKKFVCTVFIFLKPHLEFRDVFPWELSDLGRVLGLGPRPVTNSSHQLVVTVHVRGELCSEVPLDNI